MIPDKIQNVFRALDDIRDRVLFVEREIQEFRVEIEGQTGCSSKPNQDQ